MLVMAFFKVTHQKVYLSVVNKAWTSERQRKYWFWQQGFFQREASTNFSVFLYSNILFPECSKNNQNYFSDISTLFESILRIKIKNLKVRTISIFSWTGLILHGMEYFCSRSMNIRALAKVLSPMTRICLPLVLRNNHSLNALNFRRL